MERQATGKGSSAENGSVVSDSAFIEAIGKAKTIDMSSYLMPKGPVLDALVAAAKNGAEVKLTLAGDSFATSIADIRKANDAAALELRGAGATVNFNDGKQSPPTPLHMKACVIDGTTGYLNERNWPSDGQDTIVKITDARELAVVQAGVDQKGMTIAGISSDKTAALDLEANVIANMPGHSVSVETESFGPGNIADALIARAKAGDDVRLVMVQSDMGAASKTSIEALEAAGGQVRLNQTTGGEKMAIGDAGEGWVGSANATAGRPHTIDWGMQTTNGGTLAQLASHFEATWNSATPFNQSMEPARGAVQEALVR